MGLARSRQIEEHHVMATVLIIPVPRHQWQHRVVVEAFLTPT
jgi:hypothetical protein